ncbi:MAG: NAD(P)/FAD-dependent oxidoreductase [Aggregatilineales bacterium]
MQHTQVDIAIIGGGPAGLEAALILARTRKKIVVFDSPEQPRNGASHGVHNFVGLDGLLPSEIREQAWKQIEVYDSAELRREIVMDVQPVGEHQFSIVLENSDPVTAKHVILAAGFRNIYPDVSGFAECWGDSIIICPFCDGYENRDRVWGIVATSTRALEHMPKLSRNWTSTAKILLSPDVPLSQEARHDLEQQGISVHEGDIVSIQHDSGKVNAVTLSTGETVEVGTLIWGIDERPLTVTEKVIANFELELNERGYINVNPLHQTSVQGLWAVGDVLGWSGALGAAFQASQAAFGIVGGWYGSDH